MKGMEGQFTDKILRQNGHMSPKRPMTIHWTSKVTARTLLVSLPASRSRKSPILVLCEEHRCDLSNILFFFPVGLELHPKQPSTHTKSSRELYVPLSSCSRRL